MRESVDNNGAADSLKGLHCKPLTLRLRLAFESLQLGAQLNW